MHGYFKGLLVGYALDQVGGALLGGLESAVSDAPVNPDRIAQLADQINKQKAAISQHQAELDKWVGTTAQVDASRYAAATAIASETTRLPSWSDSCNPYGCPAGSRQEGDGYAAAAKLVAPEDRLRIVCHDVSRESVKTPGRGTASGGVGTVTDGIHECAGRSKLHVDARVRQSTSMPAPSGTIVISVSAVVTTALNPCTGPSTGASRRRSLSFCHAETHYRSSSGTLTPCKTFAT
jgi:hypothetical protein